MTSGCALSFSLGNAAMFSTEIYSTCTMSKSIKQLHKTCDVISKDQGFHIATFESQKASYVGISHKRPNCSLRDGDKAIFLLLSNVKLWWLGEAWHCELGCCNFYQRHFRTFYSKESIALEAE